MNDEVTIRARLKDACNERGVQAEIARAFDVAQSTVKRWIEGGEIPPPMQKLLDWYFFGVAPPTITTKLNEPGKLELSQDEWRVVRALATRAGLAEWKWIEMTIKTHIKVAEVSEPAPPGAFPQGNGTTG